MCVDESSVSTTVYLYANRRNPGLAAVGDTHSVFLQAGSPSLRLSTSAFTVASGIICDNICPNKRTPVYRRSGHVCPSGDQLNGARIAILPQKAACVGPNTLKEFETTVRRDFEGPGPYSAHYTLPAPSSGLFAHSKPSDGAVYPDCWPRFYSNTPSSIPKALPPRFRASRTDPESAYGNVAPSLSR